MQRAVQIGDLFVDAVDRAGILDQVVCADREEIDFLRQNIRAYRRDRDLDHDAHLDVRVERDALSLEQVLGLLEHLLGVAELLDGGDHREHDAQVAILRGAQQRAQLGDEQVVLVETDADRAVAEERVLLLFQRERRHFLIAADVQRADDDRLARHGLASLLVGVELLLLARQVVTVHEQELGAEQADALAAQLHDAHRVVRLADIALDHDAAAVARRALAILIFCEHGLALVLCLFLFRERCERRLVRIGNDLAGGAVEQQIHAVRKAVRLFARARHGRNTHRARHDRRVAGAPADAGDKADHRLGADLGSIRGRQVVRDQNAGLGDGVDRVVRNPLEVFEHALGDVADVGGAGLHVFIVHRAEHGLKILAVDKAGVLRADHLICDQIGHALDEVRIVQHEQMRVKDLRLRRADIFLRLVAQHFDLLFGFFHRIQHALLFRGRVGDRILDDRQIGFLDDKRLGMCQTFGYADRLEFEHRLFPPALFGFPCKLVQKNQLFPEYIVHYFLCPVKYQK